MLVMRRRAGESISIGADIEIQILETGPGRVKIGIVAPPQVAVTRHEVKLTREQNIAAARGMHAGDMAGFVRALLTVSKT